MNLERLNKLNEKSAREELLRCCGAKAWVDQMIAKRPFETPAELLKVAEEIWFNLEKKDWLEAFSAHPKIGDLNSLKKKFANTEKWASGEQAGVEAASEEALKALSEANAAYEKKFGFIFIVCATGKSAGQMLIGLSERFTNDAETEIVTAAKEQKKITKLRLEKLP